MEIDIKLPGYLGNMEIELAGLQDITPEERQPVDAHANRDDEVNWEQRALSSIDETIPVRESTSSTPSTQASIAEAIVLEDTLNDSSTPTLLPKPPPLSDDDGLTDCESVIRQLCEAARGVRSWVTNEPVVPRLQDDLAHMLYISQPYSSYSAITERTVWTPIWRAVAVNLA